MDDNQIINRILNGDKNLYSILMEKYHNELFKYVYNLVYNYENTEDLLQEVFLKLYNNLKKYNPAKASFRTWMYRITSNHVINYLKSADYRNNNNLEYQDYYSATSDDVERDLIKEEQINSILKIMSSILKPKHYQIMILHYFSELTVKEISETILIPEKTIYKAIKSSIAKIKEEVE